MLLDSNIIIYSVQSEHSFLRKFIAEHSPAISALSYVEVLGYPKLTEEEQVYFEQFFHVAKVLPISSQVLSRAVLLRQKQKMTLGDSIIAGTALVYGRTLVTRNIKDFQWIEQLTLLNPFDASSELI